MQVFAQYEPKNFGVHTPTTIDFIPDGHGQFEAVLDNQYNLKLDKRSQISSQLRLGMDKDDIKQEFLDGRFFIVDDKIIDHRFKSNLKFEHTAAAVKELAAKLGFSTKGKHVLAHNAAEAFETDIFGGVGGQFNINIGFGWSPFELDIEGAIEMIRLICENGAVARTPMIDRMIPMMNRWEDNLKISHQVMRHSFDKQVRPRLAGLVDERISIADLDAVGSVLTDLLDTKHLKREQFGALEHMSDVVSQAMNIPGLDKLNNNQRRFITAPMTAYDAYNIVTEAMTHHVARDKTNTRGQAFVTGLLFNDQRKRAATIDLDSLVVDTKTFSDPNRAFFGETCH